MYREKDLLDQKIVRERLLTFDYTDSAQVYLAFITKAILSKIGASYLFNDLLPKVRLYIENHLFDIKIDLEDRDAVTKLNFMPIRGRILETFAHAINKLWQTEEIPQSITYYKVSDTSLFHTSEPIYPAKKSVFNALPYPKRSEYEKAFMMWLDSQTEVTSFTKILTQFPFRIPYYYEGFLRYYRPDFVVRANENFYLIETKGLEEPELPKKIHQASEWCEKVSELTNLKWQYLKISKDVFERYKTQSFKTLATALSSGNA